MLSRSGDTDCMCCDVAVTCTACVVDANVHQLLPLAEEYQIVEVKKKCEEFLLTKPGSMELLVTAQTYQLHALLHKCIDTVRHKSFIELQKVSTPHVSYFFFL